MLLLTKTYLITSLEWVYIYRYLIMCMSRQPDVLLVYMTFNPSKMPLFWKPLKSLRSVCRWIDHFVLPHRGTAEPSGGTPQGGFAYGGDSWRVQCCFHQGAGDPADARLPHCGRRAGREEIGICYQDCDWFETVRLRGNSIMIGTYSLSKGNLRNELNPLITWPDFSILGESRKNQILQIKI